MNMTTSLALRSKLPIAFLSLSLLFCLNACSFDPIENSVLPSQLSAIDTTMRNLGGTFSWTTGGSTYTARARYDAASKSLIAKIDNDNYLTFSLLSTGSGAAVGSYTLSPVAISPTTASVNMKLRKSDNTGFVCAGVTINGTLNILQMKDNKINGNFNFNSSANELGSFRIITVDVSGNFSDVPY